MENENGNSRLIQLVMRFNQALNEQDVDAMMALMTEDCVFENTYPAPDGSVHKGQEQVRCFWEDFFRDAATANIREEEIFALGNRCVMRWVYTWENIIGQSGHIRGVDIYRERDGLISEKLSYVKG